MTTFTQRLVAAALVAATNLSMPSGARCQSGQPDRRAGKTLVAVAGGMFVDDLNENGGPVAAAGMRLGRELNRFVVAEMTASFIPASLWLISTSGAIRSVATPFVTGDVGMQLQLPLGVLLPYVGATAGGFRRAGSAVTSPDVGWTLAGVGGARLRLGSRIFLQGEMKLRRDVYDFGRTIDAQFTAALGGRF